MKKSLVLLVAFVATVAFAASACAFGNWACYEMSVPPSKVICKPEVLCKGAAKGVVKLCGPCAPVIKYKGSWLTMVVCPPGPKAKVVKKLKKRMKK